MIYPCYGCIARAPGCHSQCPAYQRASKAHQSAADTRKRERSAWQFAFDVKDGGMDRWRRSGGGRRP